MEQPAGVPRNVVAGEHLCGVGAASDEALTPLSDVLAVQIEQLRVEGLLENFSCDESGSAKCQLCLPQFTTSIVAGDDAVRVPLREHCRSNAHRAFQRGTVSQPLFAARKPAVEAREKGACIIVRSLTITARGAPRAARHHTHSLSRGGRVGPRGSRRRPPRPTAAILVARGCGGAAAVVSLAPHRRFRNDNDHVR